MIQPVRNTDNELSLTEQVNRPPAAIDAEQELLGGLMLDKNAWFRIQNTVSTEDFYRTDHQLIYAAICTLADGNQPCDAITLSEFLGNLGTLSDAGGLGYLASLTKGSPSAANVESYAKIIRERALMRELITAGNDITRSAFQPEGRSGKELVDSAESLIFEIAEKGARSRAGDRAAGCHGGRDHAVRTRGLRPGGSDQGGVEEEVPGRAR